MEKNHCILSGAVAVIIQNNEWERQAEAVAERAGARELLFVRIVRALTLN